MGASATLEGPRAVAKKVRVTYSTEDRLNRRGVRARASSWGWFWIKSADGTEGYFVSCGFPEGTDRRQARRCKICGYSDGTLVDAPLPGTINFRALVAAMRPAVCPCCAADAVAIHAMAVEQMFGVNLGWRLPHMADGERWPMEYMERGLMHRVRRGNDG